MIVGGHISCEIKGETVSIIKFEKFPARNYVSTGLFYRIHDVVEYSCPLFESARKSLFFKAHKF